jgi:hypothetical protein
MRRLIITESEKRNILRQHSSLILEQSAAEKLQQIQTALGTSGDKVIGPDTTNRIVKALDGLPKKTTTSEFSCVTNHPSKKRVAYDDEKSGFQIGELVFDKTGNYYDVKDESKKYTYKCDGTTIETSNNGKIEGTEVKKDNTSEIKSKIEQYRDKMERSNEEIVKALSGKYSSEEIIKADPSLEPLVNKTGKSETAPKTAEQAKIESKPETVADEESLWTLPKVTDKLGTRPVGL